MVFLVVSLVDWLVGWFVVCVMCVDMREEDKIEN